MIPIYLHYCSLYYMAYPHKSSINLRLALMQAILKITIGLHTPENPSDSQCPTLEEWPQLLPTSTWPLDLRCQSDFSLPEPRDHLIALISTFISESSCYCLETIVLASARIRIFSCKRDPC